MTSIWSRLVGPRSDNEDTRRRELILNILLLGSSVLSYAAVIRVLLDSLRYGEAYVGAPPAIMLIVFATLLGLYFLSRLGLPMLAAYILVGIFFITGTYSLYQWGTLLAQGWLGYVLVIIMSGILIGTRFALFSTLVVTIALLVLTYLQNRGITQPNLYWVDDPGKFSDAIVFILTLGVITLVTWLSNREIERSLVRARNSEADLQKERDLLEVKVEERTRELRDAQREKMTQMYRLAAFGRSAAGLFHDLVNPLTTVSLNLEQMGSKEGSQLVKRAMDGAKKMERFILAARKQIQDKKELAYFSLADEIRQAVEILDFHAKEERVAVEFQTTRDIQMYGNAVKFNQVITNVLTNAIDAYQGMGRSPQRRVLIHLQPVGRRVRLIIQDNGKGIPRRDLDRIFEPFFTTKSIGQGTGLGLAIVKDIVEKDFGGKITVESKEGDGSTFIVEFPIKSARV